MSNVLMKMIIIALESYTFWKPITIHFAGTMNTGEKIRTLRILKGLSQDNLASMTGLSRLTYGDMERGKHEVSKGNLEKIAIALGVTTKEIEEIEEKVSNFFEDCAIQSVNGVNKGDLHYKPNP